MSRLEIIKTYKIYIGGAFPRTESGRYYVPLNKKGEPLGNVCLCSKKDAKNAVVAARKAFGSWSERAAFNRSQILYRIAEMLEGRKAQFVEELVLQGSTQKAAQQEVEASIDRVVYYAGWCDKVSQVTGSVNPVTSSHFNFSVYQPMGVIGIIADQSTSLIGLISQVIPVIASGNTVVVLAAENLPLCAVTFAEVINSSDVPGGVVNILTGKPDEPASVLGTHMDVNAIVLGSDSKELNASLRKSSALNLKRVIEMQTDWSKADAQGLYQITDCMELKTTWHPVENIGGSTSSY
ncbi:aldehyde dehydrogenase family protein [Crocinitomicaceae bacterium CZZ-1]|uniref:Aldehyde dehydrogenase family protein n=1 Tax=Taishania pollutisoli TaxID=2766479 RepID=A0A8J6U0D8_9FLAO|nr:aldehyde dehydrogenase family protein [Taishania pollutisoli]MBC9813163.1 aldehyde dehydrogenase family protein [Taishania pollutisoli]MBX2950444.1 aldehyde dehydrogenase family protein [Crocinitomicaceae bacterium]